MCCHEAYHEQLLAQETMHYNHPASVEDLAGRAPGATANDALFQLIACKPGTAGHECLRPSEAKSQSWTT